MNRKFSTWLLKIVVNRAIDRRRQMNRHLFVSLDQAISHIDALNPEISQKEINDKETAILIRWLAQGLPEKQQMVFILRDLQGFKSEEVQKILNLSETMVKSNLYHARIAIREKLTKALK